MANIWSFCKYSDADERVVGIGRLLGRLVEATFALFLCFLVLTIGVAAIPRSAVEANVRRSAATLEQEGLYPVSMAGQWSSTTFLCRDQYTDCLMLNLAAAQDARHPLRSAITSPCLKAGDGVEAMPTHLDALARGAEQPNVLYDWYWHGYLVVLKPLLTVLDYAQLRWVGCVAMLLLAAWALVLVGRRVGRAEAVLLGAVLAMMHAEVVPYTMQFASVFYVALAAIVVLLLGERWFGRGGRDLVAFYAVGAVTVYVDFLTTPVVTLGLPLLVWLSRPGARPTVSRVVWLAVAWGAGYAVLWASKWALCALTFDPGVLQNAAAHADKWSGSGEGMSRLALTVGLTRRVASLAWSMNWLWVAAVAAVAVWLRRRSGAWRGGAWLLVVAAVPVVWSLVLVHHNFVHFTFAWRSVVVALYALALWVWRAVRKDPLNLP